MTIKTQSISTTQSKRAKSERIAARKIDLRTQLWPELAEGQLWHRKQKVGWTTIPRSFPLIMEIMDSLSNGSRVSQAYLDLWCRAPDEAIVKLDKHSEMAFAAGFTGQRAVQSWSNRIDTLAKLGFILLAPGGSGKRSFAAILNPYLVIKTLEGKIGRDLYNALLSRTEEVGANDLTKS